MSTRQPPLNNPFKPVQATAPAPKRGLAQRVAEIIVWTFLLILAVSGISWMIVRIWVSIASML